MAPFREDQTGASEVQMHLFRKSLEGDTFYDYKVIYDLLISLNTYLVYLTPDLLKFLAAVFLFFVFFLCALGRESRMRDMAAVLRLLDASCFAQIVSRPTALKNTFSLPRYLVSN